MLNLLAVGNDVCLLGRVPDLCISSNTSALDWLSIKEICPFSVNGFELFSMPGKDSPLRQALS